MVKLILYSIPYHNEGANPNSLVLRVFFGSDETLKSPPATQPSHVSSCEPTGKQTRPDGDLANHRQLLSMWLVGANDDK